MTSSGPKPPARLSEFQLIAKLFAPLAAKTEGAFGLTDDAAALGVAADEELIVTTDMLVEGVHFLRDDPPASVAKKALRVNLSDLAAKGAAPRAYLLALSLSDWIGDEWLTAFASGLADDQARFGVGLIGGDTTATPGPLTISITAMGAARRGAMIRRAGARPGDSVFVSGTIGDAGAGLALLKGEGSAVVDDDRAFLVGRYRLPKPRTSLGPRLVGIATSALDVSDGLVADLGHIADVSGVRIAVEASRVPLSPALRAMYGDSDAAIACAATSGDDYEIAFTAPPSAEARIEAIARELGLSVTRIGRVDAGSGVVLLDRAGGEMSLKQSGFTHF